MRRMLRDLMTLVGLGLLGLAVAACGAGASTSPSARSSPSATAGSSSAGATSSPSPIVPVTTSVARPVRVEIPRIDVSSRLDRLALQPGGALERPPHWQVAGWYAGGPRPGANGPAVIAGHVDSPSGPAVFADLYELRAGDVVRVVTADGAHQTFRVTRLISAPKKHFPTAAVYGPTPDSQLRLITCDGTYDRSRQGYQDNLVVFATKVTS